MGCLMRSSAATLPQLNWWSMMQASSVTMPSRSGLAPRPTQQFCDASVRAHARLGGIEGRATFF